MMSRTTPVLLTRPVFYLRPSHLFVSDPEWGSCSLGVFICLTCSGIHRNIPDIGKVKSVLLSHWEDAEVQVTWNTPPCLYLIYVAYIRAGLRWWLPFHNTSAESHLGCLGNDLIMCCCFRNNVRGLVWQVRGIICLVMHVFLTDKSLYTKKNVWESYFAVDGRTASSASFLLFKYQLECEKRQKGWWWGFTHTQQSRFRPIHDNDAWSVSRVFDLIRYFQQNCNKEKTHFFQVTENTKQIVDYRCSVDCYEQRFNSFTFLCRSLITFYW